MLVSGNMLVIGLYAMGDEQPQVVPIPAKLMQQILCQLAVGTPDLYQTVFFQRVLQRSGVFEALEAKGCKDGDTVSIYDFEFDYVK